LKEARLGIASVALNAFAASDPMTRLSRRQTTRRRGGYFLDVPLCCLATPPKWRVRQRCYDSSFTSAAPTALELS